MASQKLLPESKTYVQEARKALERHRLFAGFHDSKEREADGVEVVKIRNTTPIGVLSKRQLAGRWSLHLSWTIRRVPRGELILWRSSFGLNVRGLQFVPSEGAVCLVRYDVDNERQGPGLEPLGAHLNVLQPPPLGDHIHFPALAEPDRKWTVSEVLDVFLAEEFIADLRARIS